MLHDYTEQPGLMPPVFGVATGAALSLVVSGAPCLPAWLCPPLANVEISAPLLTPVESVLVASWDTALPVELAAAA